MSILKPKIIILFTFLSFFASCGEDNYDKENLKEKRTLYFLGCKEFFYIYGYTYGMLGNHSEIIVSRDKIKNKGSNPERDLIFKDDVIFYKIKHDSLYLFVSKKINIPKRLKTKVKIIQKEIEGFENNKVIRVLSFEWS